MKSRTTSRFDREFKKLSRVVKKAFAKQIKHLHTNVRHPSLHAKKYDEGQDIWQARVTDNVRFYFAIEDETYVLLSIEKHRD